MSPRLAVIAALVLTLPGGCDAGLGSDPLTGVEPPACAPGHTRTERGCLLPVERLVPDGAVADWDEIEPVALQAACAGPPCDGLLPAQLQAAVALRPGGEPGHLWVRLLLAGGAAPDPDDPELRWSLTLAPPAGSGNRVIDRIVAGGAAPAEYRRADAPLRPDPISPGIFDLVWTADGFEAWVAVNFLPALATLVVAPGVERRDGDGWVAVTAVAGVPICFEPRPRGPDPCEVPR